MEESIFKDKKMVKKSFDTSISDSQATKVNPVDPKDFNFSAYEEYERSLLKRCDEFWKQKSEGVLVYRRMRVAEVFSYDCRDMKKSLEWQLGGLQESLKYQADVPNFLEPWYGLGTAAAAFGLDYRWDPGQAPAVNRKFSTTEEALQVKTRPIADTPIGKQTLQMIDYFMEMTDGRLPMSYCDVQSPLNAAGNIIDTSNFLMDFYMNPDAVSKVMDKIADLIIEFTEEQIQRIKNALVFPGHGFASSRAFTGFGMSDDNLVMLPGDIYSQLVNPSFEKTGIPFGGPVLHSCGNWEDKIDTVKAIQQLKMVDAAFSAETDPSPNNGEDFSTAFSNTGITVNARIVGDLQTIEKTVKQLWKPGMKLIVVTYCKTPTEQEEAYKLIHDICK